MRAPTLVLLAAAAVGLAGCGSAGSSAASRPVPPAPVTLSAFVAAHAVRLSPARLGAGPVLLTVANQSRRASTVLLARAGAGTHATFARTAAIDPGGVAQVKLELPSGRYTVSAVAAGGLTDAQRTGAAARAVRTTLRVGPLRPGGGDQVLAP